MFESLTERLQEVFRNLSRRGKLGEADVDAALREVRLALLEADVNFRVVKDFLGRVRERAIGAEVSRALNPAQQVIKIVGDELVATLGQAERLNLTGPRPRVVMLVGLQGSGKTTLAGKLALRLRGRGERVTLVAADLYRPAAVLQLQTLGRQIGVPVFAAESLPPPEICAQGITQAERDGSSVVIVDTAGRLQIDDQMMAELEAIKAVARPAEILLVADAMTGQEAVRIAEGFHQRVGLTGLALTKMDGDARGGAAISMRAVTGVPIKLLGTGEKMDALDEFHPGRLSSRILGMGDVLALIEKAESALDEKQAAKQVDRLMSGEFTLEDFADQLRQVRKLGPLGQLLELLPGGMGQMARQVDPREAEGQLRRTEAILNSMTPQERRDPDVLNASRRRRIARGSGNQVQDVNQLLKQYRTMQKLFKQMGTKGGMRGLGRLFG